MAKRAAARKEAFLPNAALQSIADRMSIMTEQAVIDRKGIENLIPSEFFSQLVSLVSLFPYLKPLLPRLIQVRLVLDANRVYGELLWRLKRRRVVTNQSGLHEAIASGLVVAYAPAFLQQEIEEHLSEIAARAQRPLADAEREWKLFSNILHFHDPKDESAHRRRCRDGDDIAYLAVCHELAPRAIYSTDKDFLTTDAPLLSVIVDTTLRITRGPALFAWGL
jgi:predicted nucleic acid-binding protein